MSIKHQSTKLRLMKTHAKILKTKKNSIKAAKFHGKNRNG